MLDAVRGIQQEANIDAWYDKAFVATQAKDWPSALHYSRKVHNIDPSYKWCEAILNRANVFLGNFPTCKENLFESLLHFSFNSESFQGVFVDDIREPKTVDDNAVKGKIVVWGQVYGLLQNQNNEAMLDCLKIRVISEKNTIVIASFWNFGQMGS